MGYFSNGTEGMSYEEKYCSKCLHEKPDDGGCMVWFLHMLHNYKECNNKDSMLHVLIPLTKDGLSNDECSMFVRRDQVRLLEQFANDYDELMQTVLTAEGKSLAKGALATQFRKEIKA